MVLIQWRLKVSVVLFAVVLAAPYAVAQNASIAAATKHPRIGLVLEGGGALGLAHIGAIQWLEEHRIPVSYVAGTSMGGLLGSLYATRSAVEARELVQTIRSSSSRNDKMITARENGPGKTVEGGPLLSESSTSEPRT